MGQALVVLPWALLAVPTVIALADPAQTTTGRMTILGLVAATAAWVFFGRTWADAHAASGPRRCWSTSSDYWPWPWS